MKKNKPYMEMGGNPAGMYWDGTKYVKAKGSGTYNNGVYYQQGGPAYYPPKEYPGYYKPYAYIEDGGNMGELQYGGYIPAPGEAVPTIPDLNAHPGHMAYGGYIPASINAQPQVLRYDDGRYHMQMGGLANRQSDYWEAYPYLMDGGNITELEYGGMVRSTDMPEMKKGGNWIQGAVNPAHKGYCTPMTKSTCTPRRKAFAETMKKHHGFHQYGGPANPFHPLAQYADGGFGPDANGPTEDEASGANSMYTPQETPSYNPAAQTGVVPQAPEAAWRAGMTDQQAQANINAGGTMNADGSYGQQQPKGPNGWQKAAGYGRGFNNLLGAGLMTASQFASNKSQKDSAAYNRSLGMSSNMATYQNPGSHGDYTQQGQFRPNAMVPGNAGYYAPKSQYGGMQYKNGGEYHLDTKEIERLKKLGYQIEEI